MRQKVWNRAVIAHEIRRLYESGNDLSWTGMRRDNANLLAAGCRYFGGWQDAVEFAGIDYEKIRRVEAWTAERVTADIVRLHESGVDLSLRAMCADPDRARVVYAAGRYFFSWREAVEAAGFDYDSIVRQKTWSRREIQETILELHRCGEDLSSRHMDQYHQPLVSAARKCFGNWEQAVAAVGLDYEAIRKRQIWSREKILARIRQLHLAGENLRSTSVIRAYPALYAATQKKRYFGGWTQALQEAGLVLEAGRGSRGVRTVPSPSPDKSAPVSQTVPLAGAHVEYRPGDMVKYNS